MPTPAEIKQVSDIFVSLLNNRDLRMAKGLRMRTEMHEKMARGEKPDCYRADFVRKSAAHVLGEMSKLGVEFNETHKDDAVSIGDLLDIAATVLDHLKKKL